MSNNEIALRIKGRKYGGWTSASVEKSLYTMTGAFGLSATDIFPGNFEKWDIKMGDECSVLIDNQVVITGYIEDIPISYDATSHSIQFGGRDKTGDLVDCSFVSKPAALLPSGEKPDKLPNEWINQAIGVVIAALCKPFNISVFADKSVFYQVGTKTPDRSFKATEGDTVFELILKLCKMVGVLPVSYGDGKLTLTGTGIETAFDTLELGKNILSGSIDRTDKDRFQTYICKGQGTLASGDQKTVSIISHPKGFALDEVVRRHRPIVIFPETKCTPYDCQQRVKWESLQRAGRSIPVNYKVQGWTQSNGKVWPLNTLVTVKDHLLGINSTMLIADVKYSLSNDSGETTRLSLVHPMTFKMPLSYETQRAIQDVKISFDHSYEEGYALEQF